MKTTLIAPERSEAIANSFWDTKADAEAYDQASAVAEEKAFSAKTNALFLSLFLIWVAVLMFFQLQAYLDRTGN